MENLDIEKIIVKSLSDALSADEQRALNAWRREHEENERAYRQFSAAWRQAGHYSLPAWDDEGALHRLEERMEGKVQTSPARQPARRIQLWKTTASVAAAVVLVLALTFFLDFSHDPEFISVSATSSDLELELPDGTLIHLQKGAAVRYPDSFNSTERVVEMTGQVYFNVARNQSKPFSALTERARVTVLGTAFVVDASEEQSKVTTLYVTEGKVAFQSRKNEEVVLTVEAGQQAMLSGNMLQPSEDPDFNDIAWHTRTLEFRNVRVEEAVADISACYNVEIDLDQSLVRDCSITAPLPFQDAPLADVLEIMEVLLSVEIEQTGDRSYMLRGGKCK